MAYIYLFNLYDELEKKSQMIRREQQACEPDTQDYLYQQGRLDVLDQFKKYLADNMNDKLPKRLRKKLAAKN